MRDRIKDLRRVKASEIQGAPWNWRKHPKGQRDAVSGSLEELGFFSPLEVRELESGSLQLVDGHLRQEIIAADIGPDTLIPVVVTDLDEAEAKKANLVKDPLAALATADTAKLDSLLREVSTGSEALSAMLGELGTAAGGVPPQPGRGAGGP